MQSRNLLRNFFWKFKKLFLMAGWYPNFSWNAVSTPFNYVIICTFRSVLGYTLWKETTLVFDIKTLRMALSSGWTWEMIWLLSSQESLLTDWILCRNSSLNPKSYNSKSQGSCLDISVLISFISWWNRNLSNFTIMLDKISSLLQLHLSCG